MTEMAENTKTKHLCRETVTVHNTMSTYTMQIRTRVGEAALGGPFNSPLLFGVLPRVERNV